LTSVTVQGLEDQNGYANNWIVSALAICATPPPGLERITATSPSDSLNKTVTATCPSGKRLGGGGEITAGGGQVVLEDIRLNNLAKATVQGVEDEDGTAGNWVARAFAICANPVAGLERVVATSPTDSSDKSATATCPAGKRVVGAGSEIGGGGGQVVMDDLRPNAALDSVAVQGFEDEDGTAGNWLVRAYAICAAASQRVVAQSPTDDINKNVTATCPGDMEATGGGGDITGGAGQVKLGIVRFTVPTTTTVFVFGLEDDNGYAGNWFVRAYAICATALPGHATVADASAQDSSSTKTVTTTCPLGTRVVGAAGAIFDPSLEVVLDEITPNAALPSVTATGFEDETGTSDTWRVIAYAICATPPPGLELVSAIGDPDSDPASGVTATCPSGKNLLGTGADIDGGLGQVVFDDFRPNAGLTNVAITGLEDETGHASDWFLRAYAICANP
jgi:hypothetical protein